MSISNAQYNFFQILKNSHKRDTTSQVLSLIAKEIDCQVVHNVDYSEDNYTIYKDECNLFAGTYDRLLENLFDYIFDPETYE